MNIEGAHTDMDHIRRILMMELEMKQQEVPYCIFQGEERHSLAYESH